MVADWVRVNARAVCCVVLVAASVFALGRFAPGPVSAPGASAQTVDHPLVTSQSAADLNTVGPIDDAQAARFLAQTTFGPTLADIQHLRAVGYDAWLDEQFAVAPSYELPYIDKLIGTTERARISHRLEAWLLMAMGGPDPVDPQIVHNDQLRQRVAFALSEIFVVSDAPAVLWNQPRAMSHYYDTLTRDAFGNFRTLLEDVTVHPVMGAYLSMLGNQKSNAAKNLRPDENYAREIMQLFSVGQVQLNLDGSPQLSNGQPIPSYNQNTVRGFAHVFTGWNFAHCRLGYFNSCGGGNDNDPAPDWRQPMAPFESYHDTTTDKQLLTYPGVALTNGVLLHGGDARAEMTAALDNIFNHPNVGPFIVEQLIQRMVTSNPSPAYIARVASVFNDNGHGVRGDLAAVVRAIVLDNEARLRDDNGQPLAAIPPRFGKLREPVLVPIQLWRALDARAGNGRYNVPLGFWLYYGQAPLRAQSVFNFFHPDYRPSGGLVSQGMVAPELEITTDTQIIDANNDLGKRIFSYVLGPNPNPADVLIDLSRDAKLAADPTQLVDRYNVLFMSGQMSDSMHSTLLDYLSGIDGSNQNPQRVQEALYLILNSPEYSVQK
ncbi:DUF1800 domain-containing protein [Lysobacter tyrosinilyticus]